MATSDQLPVLSNSPSVKLFSVEAGRTPLHHAAECAHSDAVAALLAAGADANAKAERGLTPLHWAAFFGGMEAVKILVAAGADVNAKAEHDKTALDLATAALAGTTKVADKERMDSVIALLKAAGGKTGAELDAEQKAPPAPPQ